MSSRREFLKVAFVAAGLALTTCLPAKIAAEPVQIAQQNIHDAEYKRSLDEAVNDVMPNWVRARYEWQIHSDSDNEKRFKGHDHPMGTPNDAQYWESQLVQNADRLKELDLILDVGFFEDNDGAIVRMLENGYAYAYVKSDNSNKDSSFIFGKILQDKSIKNNDWGRNETCRVIIYDELAPSFESYTKSSDIYGRRVIIESEPVFDKAMKSFSRKEPLYFINQTDIHNYAAFVYEYGRLLQLGRNSPLSFYEKMILNEVSSSKSQSKIEERFRNAIIHHEMNHYTDEDDAVKGEIIALLTQAHHQPYLTLATIYESAADTENVQSSCSKASKQILHAFEEKGFSLDHLADSSEKQIVAVIDKIIKKFY